MKRITAIFLSLFMILSMINIAYADETLDTKVCFELTSDGEHVVTVPTGTEIVVTYSLDNETSEESFDVSNITNEIYYDHTFFELVEDSIEKVYNQNAALHVYSNDQHAIYFNDFHLPNAKSYADGQVVGRFKLKVLATSGNSTITSNRTSLQYRGVSYQLGCENLTVFVDQPLPVMYKVTYDNNGSISTEEKPEGTIILPGKPFPGVDGYEFVGWEHDGIIYKSGDEFELTGDVTFTAKWKEIIQIKNYTLSFDTNGGTEVKSVSAQEGTVINLSDYTTTRTGYTFEGWYSDEGLTSKVTSITLDANKTVYAKWKKESSGGGGGGGGSSVSKFTITFADLDGTKLDSLESKEGSTVDLTKYIFQKEGYVFDGWYTEKELVNKVTSIKITKDITLYAKWTKKDDSASKEHDTHPEMLTKEHYAYIVGREGGRIEPMANITRAEVATIFFRLLTEEAREKNITRTNNFVDVAEDSWYNTAVSTLAQLGIVNGRTEDTFAPNAYITRAEFTAIATRFSDSDYVGKDMFSDIEGHWANAYINAAASLGWVEGNNGIFRPDDKITRAEVMTIVNRVLNRVPRSEADLHEDMTRWEDNANTNAWYYLAVQEATNSHDYELDDNGTNERWVNIKANPDWTEFEK